MKQIIQLLKWNLGEIFDSLQILYEPFINKKKGEKKENK